MTVPSLGEQYSGYARQEETLRFGMWIFLASESLLFGGLFALYAAYRGMYTADFDEAVRHNTLVYGTVNTYILLSSSLTVALSVWATRRARARLAVGFLLALLNLLIALRWGRRAEANPWFSRGFEWLTPSPPPKHNFPVPPRLDYSPYDYTLSEEEARDRAFSR